MKLIKPRLPDGSPVMYYTSIHAVHDDMGRTLADIIKEQNDQMSNDIEFHHPHEFKIATQERFNEWLMSSEQTTKFRSVLLAPGEYVVEGSINLSQLGVRSITGVIEGGEAPTIIIRNPDRWVHGEICALFYEDEDGNEDPLYNYTKRVYDIRFFIKNINIKIEIDQNPSSNVVLALSKIPVIENCCITTENIKNTIPYKIFVLSDVVFIDRVRVVVIDHNTDINPKNEYVIRKNCPHHTPRIVILEKISNGFGKVE